MTDEHIKIYNKYSIDDKDYFHLQSKKLYQKYKKKYMNIKNIYQTGGSCIKPYLNFSDEHLLSIDKFKYVDFILQVSKKNNIDVGNSTFFDIGSGHGDITLGASFFFKKSIGFDINNNMLEISNQNLKRLKELRKDFDKNKVKFIKGGYYNNLEISADVILLKNSIHFANPDDINQIIKNLLKHLNQNGILIIDEPNVNFIFGNPELNKKGEFRKKKINQVLLIREKINQFISNNQENIKIIRNNHIYDKNNKKVRYLFIIKNK